ncbi:hypothetical protein [Collimonas arenae]|uniref:hypothetical protein n=1 Tax=Collimonas arenae TaxID=279058 RepID=UPI0012E04DB7|nr:hypothetical protein [Collimonas arenae]
MTSRLKLPGLVENDLIDNGFAACLTIGDFADIDANCKKSQGARLVLHFTFAMGIQAGSGSSRGRDVVLSKCVAKAHI